MRIWIALAVALAVSPAAADPHCKVTIAHAPEDVRPVVEAWINGEANCIVGLEIRIVPTAGDYYLYARDVQGRVRERIVPDAHTAGVLVASWIADDRMTRAVPMPAAAMGTEVLAPGSLPLAAPKGEPARRWVSLGVTADLGARAEIDLISLGRWAIGITASMNHGYGHDELMHAGIRARYWKALAYVAPTFRLGRWHARPLVAIGTVLATGNVVQFDLSSPNGMQKVYDLSTTYATAQGALMLGRFIGDNWSIHLGPIATLATPRVPHKTLILPAEVPDDQLAEYDPTWLLYAGVQRRLW